MEPGTVKLIIALVIIAIIIFAIFSAVTAASVGIAAIATKGFRPKDPAEFAKRNNLRTCNVERTASILPPKCSVGVYKGNADQLLYDNSSYAPSTGIPLISGLVNTIAQNVTTPNLCCQ